MKQGSSKLPECASKRIVIVASTAPPLGAGGIASAHYNLFRMLRSAGCEVSLVTYGDNVSAPADDKVAPQDEITRIFLDEAREVLGRCDSLLNTWRDNLHTMPLVQNLQREIHTFKGGARMAGLEALGTLSHAMEDLLERTASHQIPPSESSVMALEQGCDRLNLWVEQISRGQTPEPGNAMRQQGTVSKQPQHFVWQSRGTRACLQYDSSLQGHTASFGMISFSSRSIFSVFPTSIFRNCG